MTAHYTKSPGRKRQKRVKPGKPHPDFPLTANGNGQWSKKIRQRVYYFGPWEDPNAALQLYLDQKDALLAGRKPRSPDDKTVRDLSNRFLSAKKALVETGEISKRHWNNYRNTCDSIIERFGRDRVLDDLGPDDFEELRANFAKGVGPETLGNHIQRTRSIFKYAWDADLVDRPIKMGPSFKKPSKKVRRRLRVSKGDRSFEAAEVRAMLKEANLQLRAMILLGINCGFGNYDVATLPRERVKLRRGWHEYERPKTEVQRRCPLWPETIEALKEVQKIRPEPLDARHDHLFFVTSHGRPWVRLREGEANDSWIDSIGLEFGKLRKAVGANRKWVGFYSLRRTFRTVADGAKDQVAANFVMGHVDDDNDMGAVYRQRIEDERLLAVTDCVHSWLFDGIDQHLTGVLQFRISRSVAESASAIVGSKH
jgi:integrase